jgi:hypothetical protein
MPAIYGQHSLLLVPVAAVTAVTLVFQLPTGGLSVLHVIHRLNSDYFLEQHQPANVHIADKHC